MLSASKEAFVSKKTRFFFCGIQTCHISVPVASQLACVLSGATWREGVEFWCVALSFQQTKWCHCSREHVRFWRTLSACFRHLSSLSAGRGLVLVGDKGYVSAEEMKGDRDPHIAYHGSLSCMVSLSKAAATATHGSLVFASSGTSISIFSWRARKAPVTVKPKG